MKFLILLILIVSCCNAFPFVDRIVNTTSGTIRGTTSYYRTYPVQTFLGIPYAQPPVGSLRFMKPEPVKKWTGIFTADHMPPACIQFTTYPYPWYDTLPGKSEDCLYLNIWVPGDTKANDRKAVLFWIHGGGFMFGSNRKDIYDGRVMATVGDVIVVSTNYRLGPFGFLTSRTADAPGNVGLHDQLEALKWVHANIESFGGDPSRITIDGQSAGSASVSAFCISPLTKGFFSAAILQSDSILFFTSGLLEPNMQLGQRLAESVGCASENLTIWQNSTSVISCLRGQNATDLVYALYHLKPAATVSFVPIYGEEFLPRNPTKDLKDGNFNNVPLLIGDVPDEGSYMLTANNADIFGFFGYKDPVVNKTLGENILRQFFNRYPDIDDLVQYYLGDLADNHYDAIRRQVFTAEGDVVVTCSTVYFAESYAAGNNNVYYYLFSHRPSTTPWAPWMGIAHRSDVKFTFGSPLRQPWLYQPEEVQLSANVIDIWSHFVKNRYPSDRFAWPKYSRKIPVYSILNTEFEDQNFGSGPSLENCNFHRRFYGI